MNKIVMTDKRGNEIALSDTVMPQSWLVDFFGGTPSSSGIRVNAETALTVSFLAKAINLIAGAVAKCPTHIYRVNGSIRTIDRTHPAYKLVRYQPNKYQRAFDFHVMQVANLILYGNAYAPITLDARGRPIEMIPLPERDVQITTTPAGIRYEASMFYDDGSTRRIFCDESEMLHIRWLTVDGWTGNGVLDTAKEILGQTIAMQRYSGSFFQNSARPGIAITHPGKFNSSQGRKLFREDWQSTYGGTMNANKVAILDEGMDIKEMHVNQQNAQFVETYRQCGIDVANAVGLPPSKLGIIESSAYKSLEQDQLSAKSDCYSYFIANFADAYTDKLLSTEEKASGEYEVGFDTTPLDVADMTSRGTYFQKATGNNTAWLTPNEVRSMEGKNPIEGGDELPRAAAPATAPSVEDDDEDEDTNEAAAALSIVLAEAVQRAVNRAIHQAARGYKANAAASAYVSVSEDTDKRVDIIGSAVKAYAIVAGKDERHILSTLSTSIDGKLFGAISNALNGEPSGFEERLTSDSQRIVSEIMQYV